jgi:hypothetical protein
LAHRANALKRPEPESEPTRKWLGRALLLPLIILAEFAWFRWILRVPLPNIQNLGTTVCRFDLLAFALPHVVPGVRFDQSHLGNALRELSHIQNLPQRLPLVLAAAFIAAAAFALGSIVLRWLGLHRALDPWERWPLAFLLGASGLGVATLLAGRVGWLGPWPVRVALTVAVAIGAWNARREPWGPLQPPSRSSIAFALIAGPFVLVMALGAMLPTVDYDAIEYHVQGPKEYYQAGRIAYLPHNVYTNMPFGVEMLHLLGMELLDDWWQGALASQLLVAGFAPVAAALIAATARRWGSPRAGWFAALVYLTTPWVYRLAELPYVEGPLCAYHAALIYALGRAWAWTGDAPSRARLWGIIGLLAGGAMACKYPALVSAVVPFGLLALAAVLRQRSGGLLLAYVAGWAVIMTPWLARNVIDTGNPVYPLAYEVFGGRDWDAARQAQWTAAHGPRPISAAALADALLDVAGRSDWHSPLYAALAPLALLPRTSRRLAVVLWFYVAYLFLTWWLLTHRLDRFWLPLLPPLAVLAGLGADWTSRRAWSIVLVVMFTAATVLNFTLISTALTGLNEWTGDLRVLRTRVPALTNPALAELDARLPPRAKVLLVGQAAVFHLNHPVVYNTVFNRETFETLARNRTPAQVAQSLHERGITHIYVDWFEIDRYRSPGNYGFTPYITPRVFTALVATGVLDPPEVIARRHELYRVR